MIVQARARTSPPCVATEHRLPPPSGRTADDRTTAPNPPLRARAPPPWRGRRALNLRRRQLHGLRALEPQPSNAEIRRVAGHASAHQAPHAT